MLTVGELRAALASATDDLVVVVSVNDRDGERFHAGGCIRTTWCEGAGESGGTFVLHAAHDARAPDASAPRLDLRPRVDGGVLRLGDAPADQIDLGAMEFALLQLLADRRRIATSEHGAYVPSQEILDVLPFRSGKDDLMNVRELVHRVRRKLMRTSQPGLIESKHLVGYRLAEK